MKKYKVEVYYDQVEYYIVEAESAEQAVEKVESPDKFDIELSEPAEKRDLLWEAQSAEEIKNELAWWPRGISHGHVGYDIQEYCRMRKLLT